MPPESNQPDALLSLGIDFAQFNRDIAQIQSQMQQALAGLGGTVFSPSTINTVNQINQALQQTTQRMNDLSRTAGETEAKVGQIRVGVNQWMNQIEHNAKLMATEIQRTIDLTIMHTKALKENAAVDKARQEQLAKKYLDDWKFSIELVEKHTKALIENAKIDRARQEQLAKGHLESWQRELEIIEMHTRALRENMALDRARQEQTARGFVDEWRRQIDMVEMHTRALRENAAADRTRQEQTAKGFVDEWRRQIDMVEMHTRALKENAAVDRAREERSGKQFVDEWRREIELIELHTRALRENAAVDRAREEQTARSIASEWRREIDMVKLHTQALKENAAVDKARTAEAESNTVKVINQTRQLEAIVRSIRQGGGLVPPSMLAGLEQLRDSVALTDAQLARFRLEQSRLNAGTKDSVDGIQRLTGSLANATTVVLKYGLAWRAMNFLLEVPGHLFEIDRQMTLMSATMVGQNDRFEQLRRSSGSMFDIMTQMGMSAEKAGGLIFELNKSIDSSAARQAALQPAIALTTLKEVDQADAIRTLVGLYRIFGDSLAGASNEQEKFTMISDQLIKASNISVGSVKGITEAMQLMAAQAKSSGVGFTESVAMVTLLNDALVKNSRSGSEMSRVLQKLQTDGVDVARAFGIGGITVDKQVNAFDLLRKVMEIVRADMSSTGVVSIGMAQKIKEAFGTIQAERAIEQLALSWSELPDRINKIASSAGTTGEVLRTMQQSASAAAAALGNELLVQLEKIMALFTGTQQGQLSGAAQFFNTLQLGARAFGEGIESAYQSLAKFTQGDVGAFLRWIGQNPGLLGAAVGFSVAGIPGAAALGIAAATAGGTNKPPVNPGAPTKFYDPFSGRVLGENEVGGQSGSGVIPYKPGGDWSPFGFEFFGSTPPVKQLPLAPQERDDFGRLLSRDEMEAKYPGKYRYLDDPGDAYKSPQQQAYEGERLRQLRMQPIPFGADGSNELDAVRRSLEDAARDEERVLRGTGGRVKARLEFEKDFDMRDIAQDATAPITQRIADAEKIYNLAREKYADLVKKGDTGTISDYDTAEGAKKVFGQARSEQATALRNLNTLRKQAADEEAQRMRAYKKDYDDQDKAIRDSLLAEFEFETKLDRDRVARKNSIGQSDYERAVAQIEVERQAQVKTAVEVAEKRTKAGMSDEEVARRGAREIEEIDELSRQKRIALDRDTAIKISRDNVAVVDEQYRKEEQLIRDFYARKLNETKLTAEEESDLGAGAAEELARRKLGVEKELDAVLRRMNADRIRDTDAAILQQAVDAGRRRAAEQLGTLTLSPSRRANIEAESASEFKVNRFQRELADAGTYFQQLERYYNDSINWARAESAAKIEASNKALAVQLKDLETLIDAQGDLQRKKIAYLDDDKNREREKAAAAIKNDQAIRQMRIDSMRTINDEAQIAGQQRAAQMEEEAILHNSLAGVVVANMAKMGYAGDGFLRSFGAGFAEMLGHIRSGLADNLFEFFKTGTVDMAKAWDSLKDSMLRTMANLLSDTVTKGFLQLVSGMILGTGGAQNPNWATTAGSWLATLAGGSKESGIAGPIIDFLKSFGGPTNPNPGGVDTDLGDIGGGFTGGSEDDLGPADFDLEFDDWSDFFLSRGGEIDGGPPYIDRVPAMLTPGERVLSREQNKQFEQMLERMGVQFFSEGGVVMPWKSIGWNSGVDATGRTFVFPNATGPGPNNEYASPIDAIGEAAQNEAIRAPFISPEGGGAVMPWRSLGWNSGVDATGRTFFFPNATGPGPNNEYVSPADSFPLPGIQLPKVIPQVTPEQIQAITPKPVQTPAPHQPSLLDFLMLDPFFMMAMGRSMGVTSPVDAGPAYGSQRGVLGQILSRDSAAAAAFGRMMLGGKGFGSRNPAAGLSRMTLGGFGLGSRDPAAAFGRMMLGGFGLGSRDPASGFGRMTLGELGRPGSAGSPDNEQQFNWSIGGGIVAPLNNGQRTWSEKQIDLWMPKQNLMQGQGGVQFAGLTDRFGRIPSGALVQDRPLSYGMLGTFAQEFKRTHPYFNASAAGGGAGPASTGRYDDSRWTRTFGNPLVLPPGTKITGMSFGPRTLGTWGGAVGSGGGGVSGGGPGYYVPPIDVGQPAAPIGYLPSMIIQGDGGSSGPMFVDNPYSGVANSWGTSYQGDFGYGPTSAGEYRVYGGGQTQPRSAPRSSTWGGTSYQGDFGINGTASDLIPFVSSTQDRALAQIYGNAWQDLRAWNDDGLSPEAKTIFGQAPFSEEARKAVGINIGPTLEILRDQPWWSDAELASSPSSKRPPFSDQITNKSLQNVFGNDVGSFLSGPANFLTDRALKMGGNLLETTTGIPYIGDVIGLFDRFAPSIIESLKDKPELPAGTFTFPGYETGLNYKYEGGSLIQKAADALGIPRYDLFDAGQALAEASSGQLSWSDAFSKIWPAAIRNGAELAAGVFGGIPKMASSLVGWAYDALVGKPAFNEFVSDLKVGKAQNNLRDYYDDMTVLGQQGFDYTGDQVTAPNLEMFNEALTQLGGWDMTSPLDAPRDVYDYYAPMSNELPPGFAMPEWLPNAFPDAYAMMPRTNQELFQTELDRLMLAMRSGDATAVSAYSDGRLQITDAPGAFYDTQARSLVNADQYLNRLMFESSYQTGFLPGGAYSGFDGLGGNGGYYGGYSGYYGGYGDYGYGDYGFGGSYSPYDIGGTSNYSWYDSGVQSNSLFDNAFFDPGYGFDGGSMDFGSVDGFANGGWVKDYAKGGWVPGQFDWGDAVPARLKPGEFVVRREVAQSNRELFESMNAGVGAAAAQAPITISPQISMATESQLSDPGFWASIGPQIFASLKAEERKRMLS